MKQMSSSIGTHIFWISFFLLFISALLISNLALESACKLKVLISPFRSSLRSSSALALLLFSAIFSSKFASLISLRTLSRRRFFSSMSPRKVRMSVVREDVWSRDDSAEVILERRVA